jgi:hypothetical protein
MTDHYCSFQFGLSDYEFPSKEFFQLQFLRDIKPSLIVDFEMEDEYTKLDWDTFEEHHFESYINLPNFISWYNTIARPFCVHYDFEPIPEEYEEYFTLFSKKSNRVIFSFKIKPKPFLEYIQSRWAQRLTLPNFMELHYSPYLQMNFMKSHSNSDYFPRSGAGGCEEDTMDYLDLQKFRLMCVIYSLGITGYTIDCSFTK